MLQNMRDKSKSWLAVIIIVVIILTFALWGVQRLFVGGSASSPVAKVNGTKISQQAFSNSYGFLRRQTQMQMGSAFFNKPDLPGKLKQQTLQHLIHITALQQDAVRAGYRIGSGVLNSFIATAPEYQQNGQFSQGLFMQAASAMGLSTLQLMSQIRDLLLTQQLQAGIIGSDFISPAETQRAMAYMHQQRKFRYLIIPSARFVNGSNVSSAQALNYYQQHQAEFRLPEKVSIQYIELSAADAAKQVKASDAQLQQFYQENPNRFQNKPYAKVAAQVKQAYVQGQVQKLLSDKVNQLTNLSYEHPNSLAPAAKQLGLQVQSTSLFSRAGEQQGILKNPQVLNAAFSDAVLNQQANSDVITLEDNSAVLLRLKQHQLATEQPFTQVKPAILKKLSLQAADKKAEQVGQQVVAEMQQGKSVSSLLNQYHLNWQNSDFVARTDKNLNPTLLQTAFLLSLPTKQQVSTKGIDLSANQYAVIDLQAARAAQQTKDEKTDKTYQQVLAHAYGQTAYELYQQHVIDSAKVELYPKNMP